MPESPKKLNCAEVREARSIFEKAWGKKWFNPLSWFRPDAYTGIGTPVGAIETWYLIIWVDEKRHMQRVAKVVRKCIPGTPTEIELRDDAIAARNNKTPLI